MFLRGIKLMCVRPDFTNTEPAANIGPFPQWADKKKIVSMDPLGHLAPWLFKDTMERENGMFFWIFGEPSLTESSGH
jgi:GTP cyclohydrolase N terminal